MGKLITIVGNNGSGKTTLANALGRLDGFQTYLESHEDRPYQPLFSKDVKRYALPNQLDYMLRRAEQERQIRDGEAVGVQDGGIDQDFFLYSRLFHHKGFLDDREFSLCQRTYQALRAGLPAPDLIVWLRAPLELLQSRLQARARMIDLEQIVTLEDLPRLEGYLEKWLVGINPAQSLILDVAGEDQEFNSAVQEIVQYVNTL
jgi:deoxyadenosine/deoxycytidine kinase